MIFKFVRPHLDQITLISVNFSGGAAKNNPEVGNSLKTLSDKVLLRNPDLQSFYSNIWHTYIHNSFQYLVLIENFLIKFWTIFEGRFFLKEYLMFLLDQWKIFDSFC